ncbi:hypothetical protein H4R21_005184, partial [Coemansia helicoidea]
MQRSEAAGSARKRRHEAAQRHCSADSPLAKRSPAAGPAAAGDGSEDGDVVFWMPMSPRGTLQSALRRRTPSAGAASDSADSADGIVRRILDARHTAATAQHDASPTNARRRTARGTAHVPRLGRTGTGSSDTDGELGPAAAAAAALDPAADATPLAQRRARAIPRPLAPPKSEKMFDKRQLLSSLLPGGLASGAPTPTVEELTGATSDERLQPLPPPLLLLPGDLSTQDWEPDSAHDLESFPGHGTELGAAAGSDPECATEQGQQSASAESAPAASAAAAEADDLDADFVLDDADIDSLLGDLDNLDGLDELMQSVDDGAAHAPSQRFRDCEKCLVLLVSQSQYTDAQAGVRTQKAVRVYSQTAARERLLLL